MSNLLIDSHTHVFPDAEYGGRWQRYLGHAPKRTGTIPELTGLMEEGGIERAVILLFPRSRERSKELREADPDRPEESIRQELVDEVLMLNRWGLGVAASDDRFIPFVGINARIMSADEIVAEIDDAVALGARGVKIIPPSMQMYGNDPLLAPVFERCALLGLPVLSQSGSGGGPPPEGADHFGRPRYYDEVLARFPKLRLILAHLGLGYEDDIAALTAAHANVWTDTSLRLSGLGQEGRWSPDELVSFIRSIGVERVLLGSNFPMANPAVYGTVLRELPFTDDERNQVGRANFERLMSA